MNFSFLFKCVWHKWEYHDEWTGRASDGWWTSSIKRTCKKCGKEQTGHATATVPKWNWWLHDALKEKEENKRRSFEF